MTLGELRKATDGLPDETTLLTVDHYGEYVLVSRCEGLSEMTHILDDLQYELLPGPKFLIW